MSPIVVFDGDMLAYKAAFSTETEADMGTPGQPKWFACEDRPRAREAFDEMLLEITGAVGSTPDQAVLCFTSKSMWRRTLFPEYKVSRKGTRSPIGLRDFKRELLERENSFMYDNIEADDLMGLFATMDEREVIIASGDKDLLQIPGKHVWMNPPTVESRERLYKSEEAGRLIEDLGNGHVLQTTTPEWSEEFFYIQTITGDSSDDIPGACAGVGPVKAKNTLRKSEKAGPLGYWETVVQLFEKGQRFPNPRSAAIRNARLVRILRTGEYNFQTHEVKPWNPPTTSRPHALSPNG